MKSLRPILFIAVMFLTASFSLKVYGQPATTKRLSPNALVADLYREHNRKHSPFFQTRSRALLYKYFAKSLADMIWKDAVHSKGEVGAIDGDPLYDAQDMEIKKFAIGKPGYEGGKAKVNVTFENFGQAKSFVFILVNGRSGWRINNIEYGEGRSLRRYLTDESNSASVDQNFEGTYQVGDTTCTVKPIKMAFEVKWAKGKGSEIFFSDTASEQGKPSFTSEDKGEDKGRGKNRFVFDNDRYESGRFIRADGKEVEVSKIH